MGIPSSPNTELYTLGKGVLTAGPWVGVTPPTYPGDYTDLGNATDMTVEVTEEVLDHFSTRSGTRKKDKQVTLESGYVLNFTLDELSVQNLKMLIRGTQTGNTLSAAQALDIEYGLRFVSDNPVGINQIWELWKVKVRPNGAFTLISDDWSTLAYTGEGLADETNHASSPYFDVTLKYPGSTTTTT